ncbi:MAG: hypothetical protein HFE66_07800 [Clostridiales bacterium]|jgi:hypothetical protein|nr:hypothetical protein [Clostridiales bacterium]
MSTYYKHTKTETIEVPYSFRCEQCMKDSGPLQATITGTRAEINSNFKNLDDKKQQKLADMAHKKLVKAVKDTYKDVTEKQIYSKAFGDKCPHCNQPQSWALGGLKKERFSTSIVCLVLGVILAIGCYFCIETESNLTIALVAGGICLVLAIGSFIFNSIKIANKQRKTSDSVQKNLPIIEWTAVQNILNEQ